MRPTLRLACVVLVVLALSLTPDAKKRKRTQKEKLSLESPECIACRNLIMNLNESAVPRAVEMLRTGGALSSAQVEEWLQEEVPKGCSFASTFAPEEVFTKCISILEEREDELVAAFWRYSRARKNDEEMAVTKYFCHETINVCPVDVTPATLGTRPDSLRSERPPETQKGPATYITASEFMKYVVDDPIDVMTYVYPKADETFKRMNPLVDQVAEYFTNSTSIRVGKIFSGMNDIPPPYGHYLQGSHQLCVWRHNDKFHPSFMRKIRDGKLSQYDILDFMYTTMFHNDSRVFLGELSRRLDMDKIKENPYEYE